MSRHRLLKNRITAVSLFICIVIFASAASLSAGNVETIDGDSLKKELSNAENNITIVDFWATWCSPCKKQMPVISNVYEKYKAKGVSVIGVAMDADLKKVNKFVRKSSIHYPVFVGEDGLGYSYKVSAIPTTQFYDRQGNLVKSHVGYINEEELTNIIDSLLETKVALNVVNATEKAN